MKTSRRLQPAVEHAQQHADDAACKFSECQQNLKARRQQLEELLDYRTDYTSGLLHKSRSGINSARMNEYSVFLERLNQAIEQTQQALDGAALALAASKQELQEKMQRVKALKGAVTRHQKSERYTLARREQHENDEHAMRIVRTSSR